MTNEQIRLLARVRVGLQRAGVAIDLLRATRDARYLEAALQQAATTSDEATVEAALQLMVQFGMTNGRQVRDPALASELLRRFNADDKTEGAALRGSGVSADPGTSSQPPAAPPPPPGRFGTPLGETTGSTPNPVPGGKNYKRGLR